MALPTAEHKEVDVLLTEQLQFNLNPSAHSSTAPVLRLPQPKHRGSPFRAQTKNNQNATDKPVKPLVNSSKTSAQTRLHTGRRRDTISSAKLRNPPASRLQEKQQKSKIRQKQQPEGRAQKSKLRPDWNEDNKPLTLFEEYAKDTEKRLHYTKLYPVKAQNAPRVRSKPTSLRPKVHRGNAKPRKPTSTSYGIRRKKAGGKRDVCNNTSPSLVGNGAEDKENRQEVERLVVRHMCTTTAQTDSIILAEPRLRDKGSREVRSREEGTIVEAEEGGRCSPTRRSVEMNVGRSDKRIESIVRKILNTEKDGFIRAAHQVYSREMTYHSSRAEDRLGEDLDKLIRLEESIRAKWANSLEGGKDDTADMDPDMLESVPKKRGLRPRQRADFSSQDRFGDNPIASILGGRRRFLHHRQLVESSLHGTGMSQWQIVER